MQKSPRRFEPTPLDASQIAVSHFTNCATEATSLKKLGIIKLNFNVLVQSKEWCALAYT